MFWDSNNFFKKNLLEEHVSYCKWSTCKQFIKFIIIIFLYYVSVTPVDQLFFFFFFQLKP